MTLWACSVDGTMFALAYVDVADPARVGATVLALRRAAAANVKSDDGPRRPLAVRGMTANAESARQSFAGALPDGGRINEHAAFFTKGLRVYQATVLGAKADAASVDTFIDGLRFPA